MVNGSAALDATFAALADPTRRAILARLAEAPGSSVGELARPFAMSLPAISKHLPVLENAGLLARSQDGRVHHCRLVAAPMQTASDWIAHYTAFWEARLDALEQIPRSTRDSEGRTRHGSDGAAALGHAHDPGLAAEGLPGVDGARTDDAVVRRGRLGDDALPDRPARGRTATGSRARSAATGGPSGAPTWKCGPRSASSTRGSGNTTPESSATRKATPGSPSSSANAAPRPSSSLTHERFDTARARADHAEGWKTCLDRIETAS